MHPPESVVPRGPLAWAARLVVWCWRHGAAVAALALALVVPAAWLAVGTLGLDTDETHMIAADLPYRQAEMRFDAAFPHTQDRLVAVVEAATPEQAHMAASALVERLAARSDLFHSVERPPAEMFLRKNGLLFLPEPELKELADRLVQTQPLLGGLAADPSLRGLLGALSLMLTGIERGELTEADLAPAMAALAQVGEDVLAGRPAALEWQELMTGRPSPPPRAFVLTRPRLDRGALVPGEEASQAVRKAAEGLGVTVRLTGPVALTDDTFRTVAGGASLSALVSLALVSVLLLAAVRSLRSAAAIILTLVAGLVLTAGFAALAVGVLNPISVAFVALFVGLAVNFGIQFTIRFRDDTFHERDPDWAMAKTAPTMARSLIVVAAAIASGFLAFVPTDYRGVSQLGIIAGAGMVIGLGVTLTLLPALLGLLRPRPERVPPGMLWLGGAEAALRRHAAGVVVVVAALAAGAALVAGRLSFDFDPLHLQDPKAEPVAVIRDLAGRPETTPYVVNALASSTAEAGFLAARLEGRPGVAHVLTLASFIPDGQADKLALVADLDMLLGPSLHPAFPVAPPTLADNAAAMDQAARRLEEVGASPRLAGVLRTILERGRIGQFERAVTDGLPGLLSGLREALAVIEITPDTLPPELVRDWVGTQGEGRVEVHPAEDLTQRGNVAEFVASLRQVAQDLSGPPVAIIESSAMVVDAFTRAGLAALVAILLLLALVLRRAGDVLLVLAPLAAGALFTAAALVALGIPVNFANVLAFPLLLGIGAAYNVSFVINWRAGMGPLLPSSTARAVLFSALSAGVAFGALALSPHRGTASMGLVLTVSLLLLVLVSFVLLPAAFALVERVRGRA